MALFEEYVLEPRERRPSLAARVRPAVAADAEALAAIEHARQGGEPESVLRGVRARLERPDELVLVADRAGGVLGYGNARTLERPPGAPPAAIPSGWYLTGVNVRAEFRRRGLGRQLTEARLRSLFEHTDEVFYFANERNRTSIRLHAELGFTLLRRAIQAPGCSFEGLPGERGIGVLFRLQRDDFVQSESSAR